MFSGARVPGPTGSTSAKTADVLASVNSTSPARVSVLSRTKCCWPGRGLVHPAPHWLTEIVTVVVPGVADAGELGELHPALTSPSVRTAQTGRVRPNMRTG